MKPLASLAALSMLLLLPSCGHKDEPEAKTVLPIKFEFNQVAMIVDWNEIDSETKSEIKQLTTETFVVDSYTDFPRCSLIDEDWTDVDLSFDDSSVIINYELLAYKSYGHSYSWVRNNLDRSYEFWSTTLVSGDNMLYDDKMCLVRNAILVNKVPATSKVTSVFSLMGLSDGSVWD